MYLCPNHSGLDQSACSKELATMSIDAAGISLIRNVSEGKDVCATLYGSWI